MNLVERPVDLQVGIVPLHTDLALRVIKIGALVLDLSDLTGHRKAVNESGRDVDLPKVFGRQPDADPLPEMRGAAPNIYRDVENLAFDYANQFALREPNLSVQPADRAALRPRMVVLHEDRINPAFMIFPLVIGLEEKTTLVAEDLRFDDDHAGYVRRNKLHRGGASCSNILSKYLP